jgi:UDP-N-acetylmuramoylalanine--D-glutamate ligase
MKRFKDKRVLIYGLGLSDGGLGMTEFFVKEGAKVTVTDGYEEEKLKPVLDKLKKYGRKITYHLGGHIKEDFLENEIIVRNPAVRPDSEYLKIAREAGKEIVMEMSLFHQLAPCPIIGVTGTRGKSTTTSLIYEFLRAKYGKRVFFGGNIRKSAIRDLDRLKKKDIYVLEISSFQLDGMRENKISSNVAVVTNMYVDHQNWHPSMDDYIDAKKSIFKYQDDDGVLIVISIMK